MDQWLTSAWLFPSNNVTQRSSLLAAAPELLAALEKMRYQSRAAWMDYGVCLALTVRSHHR